MVCYVLLDLHAVESKVSKLYFVGNIVNLSIKTFIYLKVKETETNHRQQQD